MLGKKSSGKSAKKRFFYSLEYRTKKMGGKKLAKQLFQKHTNNVTKKVPKKIVGKKFEKVFFIFARIPRPKNWGEKKRETIFSETHE